MKQTCCFRCCCCCCWTTTIILFVASIIIQNFQLIHSLKLKYDFTPTDETDPQYWYGMARADLRERLEILRPIHTRAKNVIIFLGDGMGISTITAARILKGQLNQQRGEEGFLEFDRFPHSALIKTYNIDKQVPDSAGTATAYLTGVKANFYTLGVAAKVNKDHRNCTLVRQSAVDSILKWAQESGKATGVVTTTRVTHATPAASYAHTQNRDWEYYVDEDIVDPATIGQCKDIARQLIEDEPGRSLNVVLGGGRFAFMNKQQWDPKGMLLDGQLRPTKGKRTDDRDLIEEWLKLRADQGLPPEQFAYVNDTEGLTATVDLNKIKYLFGLFNYTNMEYEKLRDQTPKGEPSLTQMTEAAIKVLSNQGPDGFVLLVEGGRIDHAHHDGFATLALHETLEFERAIRKAREMLPMEETLIITTADHSHSLVMNGYPVRGNPIQGRTNQRDSSQLPYTTLMYANGPGFRTLKQRIQQVNDDLFQLKYRVHAGIHMKESNHAGEDVAAFAVGPMAHMFGGTHEQSYIAHVMAFASCIGMYQQEAHCQSDQKTGSHPGSPGHGQSLYDKLAYTTIGETRNHPVHNRHHGGGDNNGIARISRFDQYKTTSGASSIGYPIQYNPYHRLIVSVVTILLMLIS